MPAYVERHHLGRPRDRAAAVAAVVAVQLALAFGLLLGLRVEVAASKEIVSRLISVRLQPPPRSRDPTPVVARAERRSSPAPKGELSPLGGSPGPQPARAPPSVAPVIAVKSLVAPSGGGNGAGPALGNGSGGNAGGQGSGDGDGGSELEQIAGEITPRDYPRHLGRAGVGGRVGLRFTVGVNGRVTRCAVTSSSGIPELDALTCRLIQQRFVFRPATDRYGHPVADEVEGDHEWEADRF